jgi:uncharacterized membrane protein
MITRFTAAALAAAALYCNSTEVANAAAAPRFQVLHHERMAPLALDHRAGNNGAGQAGGRAARLRFHALGRDFDLGLEPNDRLLANLDVGAQLELSTLELYRGALEGQPGTWARVNVWNGDVYALIYDGTELYAIEPAARLRGRLLDGDDPDGDSVALRLSDVQDDLRDDVVDSAAAATTSYTALVGELQAATASAGPARRLDLAMIADVEFTAKNPDAQAELLLRANYVDGIYSEQLGLQINVSMTEIHTHEPDAFSSSDPKTLLASLSSYRASSPALRAQSLVHLYTGRELDSDVVGIAYLDGVCDPANGAGLTQGSSSVFHDALITAHEIGHNLGARHDAEAGSPCASTPATYLMAARLSGSDQFSQCSVQHMAPVIAGAACLGQAYAGDVRVSVSTAEGVLLGDDTQARVTLDNLATEANANVVVTLLPSYGAQIVDVASAAGYDCAVTDGQMRCAIGTLAGGAHEFIDITLTAVHTGVASLQATAFASNDSNPANNTAVAALRVDPAVVLTASVQPAAIALGPDDSAAVTIAVSNDSALDASDVGVDVSSPFELADLGGVGASCERLAGAAPRYRCTLGALRSHEAVALHGTVHSPAEIATGQVLSGLLSATASASEALARAGTNSASAVVQAYSAIVDLESAVMSAPARLDAGARAHVVVELHSLGPDAAPQAQLEIAFPSQLAVAAATDDHGACALAGNAVRCELDSLRSGEVVEVDVEIVAAAQAGDYRWTVSASHAGLDPNAANDGAEEALQVSAQVTTAHPAASGGSGGGGGGASWLLLAVAAGALTRRRAAGPRAQSRPH